MLLDAGLRCDSSASLALPALALGTLAVGTSEMIARILPAVASDVDVSASAAG